jgi:hypothetical protein
MTKCEEGSVSTSYKKRFSKMGTPLMFKFFLFRRLLSSLPLSNTSVLPLPCAAYFVSPCVMQPNRPGPWALDKVKKRLRAEQVQRERLASERYRQEDNQGQE